MNVLGVHTGHDSSAAVVVDGKLVADAAEERFSRVKHDASLPVDAIASCLQAAGIELSQVDVVAIPTELELPALNDLFDLWGGAQEQGRGALRAAAAAQRLTGGPAFPRRPIYARRYALAANTQIVRVPHHLAHAASAYYTSGYPGTQLIVTLDGIGDAVSGAVWRGDAGRIEPLEQFTADGSLGWFYGNVTEALGWPHGDGEGTLMALAAYGDPDCAQGALETFHPRYAGGALVAPHRFPPVHPWNERGAYQWHSSEAEEIAALIPRFGRENIAAAAQRALEEQVEQIIYPWLSREGTRALSCAGGVFLNVKVNQRIWASGQVDRQHIFPNPGDGGLAAGAALYAHHDAHPSLPREPLRDVYLGPEYSEQAVEELLRRRGLRFQRVNDVAEFAAHRLAQNQTLGWFQGRMESGPRALGNRSILMDPRLAENKDLLNGRIKFRASFRPFCPSLASARAADYLEQPRSEPFMITSFDVREEKRDAIPAVVHVDGTVRPQTVEPETNPRYWNLLRAFADLTGEHAVLNTSFNVQGEPIVCHPRDAIRAFSDTGLDCLIIGDCVLAKGETI